MAYRCNPCRHTSAPFPIARSEWDMKHMQHFCPDCIGDYTLSTNKFPNAPTPMGNCNCGCKPCCCRPMCGYKPPKPPTHMDPCFPPHPGVVSPPACSIKPCVKPQHHIQPPHVVPPAHHPVVPPAHHPVVPHPVVPHNPLSPPHVTPVPKADAATLSSLFFFN
jgi:hypothetical protein